VGCSIEREENLGKESAFAFRGYEKWKHLGKGRKELERKKKGRVR